MKIKKEDRDQKKEQTSIWIYAAAVFSLQYTSLFSVLSDVYRSTLDWYGLHDGLHNI